MCFNCAGRVELHLFSPWGGWGEEEGEGGVARSRGREEPSRDLMFC